MDDLDLPDGGAPAAASPPAVGHAPRLRRLAYLLDDAFRVPGTNLRFGLDALLGLIPGGGDVAGGVVSAYTLIVAVRVGAPPSVLLRMGVNIGVDALVGAVPLLGDLFDVGFKANRRNAKLIESWLNHPQPVLASSRALLVGMLLAVFVVFAGVAALVWQAFGWLASVGAA